MKQFSLILAFCFIFSGHLWAQDSCMGNSCMPKAVQNDCTTMQGNGCIDWANGVVYATGMGVPNPSFKTQAQRSYSAYEAAKVVAKRNLLQMVEGINITSEQTVKAGMLENDVIKTQISGRLQHVQEVGKAKTMNDGSKWVTMRLFLRDIYSILVNNEQFEVQGAAQRTTKPATQILSESETEKKPTSEYGGSADTIYSGLIIDARGTGLTPAIAPKVFDSRGEEIYGSAAIDRDFVIKHGIVGYVKDVGSAKKNQRVKGKPLMIKGKLSSGGSSDLVISDEDAELLKKLDATQTFLREARVIIVIS